LILYEEDLTYLSFFERCWDGNPENRPNCDDILTNLAHMQKNYEAKPALWDKSRECLERSNSIPGSLNNALQQ